MPSFSYIANFLTACWKNITCSDSLPSPNHQQEPLRRRQQQQEQEQRLRRRLRRQQEQQRRRQRQHLDHNVASSSKYNNSDSSDSNDNGGVNNGGNNVNNAGGGNNAGSNDNGGGNNGGNNDNGGGGNHSGNNDNGGGNNGGDNNGGNNDNGGGGNHSGNNDNGGGNNGGDNNDENDKKDPLVWSIDLERHSCGEFSHAGAKANIEMRIYSQVEVGSNAILVGIYDGHVGAHASWFIRRNLMINLIAKIREQGTLTEKALQKAILTTDDGFLRLVKRAQRLEPTIVINGSSCLVGVIWKGTLFIGHVGASRAVNGVMQESDNRIIALPLTLAHNVNESWVIRQQLKRSDPNLVVQGDDGIWRIKGISQLSRSVGDAYLKRSDIRVDSSFLDYQLPGGYLNEAVVSAEPDLSSRAIKDTDRFFIFASCKFWEHITNDRAVDIVYTNPRQGIAKRLLKDVLVEAARKANMSYSNLLEMPIEIRRTIHDDMSVIVVFVDHNLVGVKDSNLEHRSFIGFRGAVGPSQLRDIDDLM